MQVQTKVKPFLMFEGNAEEAMNFYVATLPGSEIQKIVRCSSGGPGKEGSILTAIFSLAGQPVMCSDSSVHHAFTFTPSISFFIECTSDEEIERLSVALSEGGSQLMPLANYGFSRQFAWVSDRFGVSWQLNLT